MIHASGLERFYSLRDQSGGKLSTPPLPGQQKFQYLDSDGFASRYIVGVAEQTGLLELPLSVAGLHCSACVWLLENCCSLLDGLISVRVDFSHSRIRAVYNPELTAPSKIAQLIDSLGYAVAPPQSSTELQSHDQHGRDLLLRLGIAGFSAGNTMLLAISLYQGMFTGIEPVYRSYLELASLLLALPAVVFSARPFYLTALGSIRLRRVHIDLPISIAILAGFSASCINHLRGSPHVYFDSICMLIFLLLIGRWLQHKTLRHAFQSLCELPTLLPIAAQVEVNNVFKELLLNEISIDDVVRIQADSVIPVDGIITAGHSHLNLAVITGESTPISCAPGDCVVAGARNLSAALTVKVTAAGENSRIGKILSIVKDAGAEKTNVMQLTDRLSSYFVGSVLLLAAATFTYWIQFSVDAAVNNTLALLIVTCPCALGLAAPLAFAVATSRAAHSGILIKSHRALEALSSVTTILFDKTGTITGGNPTVQLTCSTPSAGGDRYADAIPAELLRVVEGLESASSHPYASALREYCRTRLSTVVADALPALKPIEIPGLGVRSRGTDSTDWLLGSEKFLLKQGINLPQCYKDFSGRCTEAGLSPIFLSGQRRVLAAFGLGDSLRAGVQALVGYLNEQDYTVAIISGDSSGAVLRAAEQSGIPARLAFSNVSPEEKLEMVLEKTASAPTAMIGDGVNDAAALSAASVGIGVRGGAEACLQAADIFITAADGFTIKELFTGARLVRATIKRSLLASLIYNTTGAALAMSGVVTPFFAAVIMPLSSLTVVLNSVFSSSFRERT